jgi:hypothetical protein
MHGFVTLLNMCVCAEAVSHGKEFKVSPPKGGLGSFCSKIFKLYNSRLERIFASTLFPDQFGSVQAMIQI